MNQNNLINILDKKKSTRLYNSNFRRNLKDKISKLNNKVDYLFIYNLINKELESKFSVNNSGVYFNINLLSDECINKLSIYISDKYDSETTSDISKIKYESYSNENYEDSQLYYGNKFTSQEKIMLKKFHTKNN